MRNLASWLSVFAAVVSVAACSGGDKQATGGSAGGGQGGSGATGGEGGSGATGGSGGATPVDPPGPKDPADAIKAAILVGSCLPDDGVNRWLNRIYNQRNRAGDPDAIPEEHVKCLASKTNGCQGVKECIGAEASVDAACKAGCAGSVLTACDNSLEFTVDCAKSGTVCDATAKQCVPAMPGPACDANSTTIDCKNGAPTGCDQTGHEHAGPACADLGLKCEADAASGSAYCVGTGASCQADVYSAYSVQYDNGIACNGAKLSACINGGTQDVDCGTVGQGFTCQATANAKFCGLGAACEPGSATKATCEGDSVVVCNAGRVDKIDCKTLGFKTCNAKYGVCSPSIYDQAP
jgi:hypothetical protein